MTSREFAYYQAKDEECAQAHADANAVVQLQRSAFTHSTDSCSACSDSIYLALKREPIDSMSEREFAYYMVKDRECESAQAASNAVKQLQIGSKNTGLLLLAIDGVLLVAFAILLHLN